MAASAVSLILTPSWSAIWRNCSPIFLSVIVRNSKTWQRDRIVSGTFCNSVVAMMKTTCGGGSSNVLSSALNAAVDSM